MGRTVIAPENSYTSDDHIEWLNMYRVESPTVNITRDELIALYNEGTVITVVYNGVTYKSQVRYLDGVMETGYGFGNPKYLNYWPEADNAEDNREPFALYIGAYSGGWELYFADSTESCTFTAYIGEDTVEYVIMKKQDYKAICDFVRSKTLKADMIKSGDMVGEMENALAIPKTVSIDPSMFDEGSFKETLDNGESLVYTVEFEYGRPSKFITPNGTEVLVDWGE